MGGQLIDRYLPAWDVSERHEIEVAASVEEAWRAARSADLSRSWVVKALFALRGLPRLGRGTRRGWGWDDFVAAGFVPLDEEPGRELVLGLVGRFWTPTGGVVRLPAAEFGAFMRPGHAKAVWNLTVQESTSGRARIATETRVRATDERARRSLLRYWRVIGPFSGMVRSRMLALIRADLERG